MEALFLLFILFIILTIVTVVGHFIWLMVESVIRAVFADDVVVANDSQPRPDPRHQDLKDLAVTEQQIARFYSDGKLNDETFQLLMKHIVAERATLAATRVVTAARIEPTPRVEPKPVSQDYRIKQDSHDNPVHPVNPVNPVKLTVDKEIPPLPPRPPRRSFSEVLNSFMEESNIRWGEIIGGLLIIGCSTALVVSLWAQISQIPVLKFLIFTTVTAILFGIGLYTEHRWKLPTTSRGILTIATLLVPLNFLAIAAVSSSNTSGALVIGSELVAPAIFLCLVYFAGRVITPGCAHVLSAGVLGSSVGQLLVRHFASLDAPPALLISLGAFPVTCYVVTVGLALRFVLRDRAIDEKETTTIFTILGTMSFAALLPFGLLLHKSGPLAMSMMYLAPIVTLWGLPLVATGTILWKRITNKELVASRTTGTALGILGLMIVLAGMILAWPNPSSIVPAALLNFAIFTALAIALEISIAHVIATICFALAYLVTFHIFAGNVDLVNLRNTSLLKTVLSVASGQALVGAAAAFIAASEWLSRRKRERDSDWYIVSACLVALVSLALALGFGLPSFEYHALWIVLGLYALGSFWIAWRRKLALFTWVGSALLLFTLAHGFGPGLSFSFPWQTALFAHATICAAVAIVVSRYTSDDPALPRSVLFDPFNFSAMISIVLGVVSLFQANTWEVTWMQAQRVFWIAGILLLLLWLNRRRLLFNAFQIALIAALVLTVKAMLQGFVWYQYLPLAFLQPNALQIQGTVLALLCLALIAIRVVVRRVFPQHQAGWRLLYTRYSVDRFLLWTLMGLFLLLVGYGSLSGVIQELGGLPNTWRGINMADFPHHEAFGLGSWIVLGLLVLAMLGTFWERRRGIYLLGAVATLSAGIPLLAGRFESQIATATAWRWLAAGFLLAGSLLLWCSDYISSHLARIGWPAVGGRRQAFASDVRNVLLLVTVLPVIVLTVTPALPDIMNLSIQTAMTGGLIDNFSYGGPLVLAALIMIGYALRERMPEFAFYAGGVFNLTVTLAFMLALATGNAPINEVAVVRLAQLNTLTFAVYALPWLSARGSWQSALKGSDLRFANFLLKLQLGIAVVLHTVLFVTVIAELLRAPGTAGIGTIAAGSFLGWLTLAIVATGVGWLGATRLIRLPAYALLGLLLAVSCIVAFTVAGTSGWLAAHVLTVCVAAAAWLMLGAAELNSDPAKPLPFPLNLLRLTFDPRGNWQRRARQCAAVAGALAVGLSLRTVEDFEFTRWWSIGTLLAISVLAAALNWKTLRRGYIYAAGLLFTLAVSCWWLFVPPSPHRITEFFITNMIAGSLAGMVWLYLELRAQRLGQNKRPGFSFHHIVAISSLSVLGLLVLLCFVLERWQSPLLHEPLVWPAFWSVVALMTACLWDRSAKYAVFGLYVLGLIAGGIFLYFVGYSGEGLAWAVNILLAVYTLFWALLWHRRALFIAIAERAGIPRRLDPETPEVAWFSAFTILAVQTITALSYWLSFTLYDFEPRALVAVTVVVQSLAFVVLAEGSRHRYWRYAAIAVFTVGMVLLGWSWLTPRVDSTWLNRSVILMLVAFGLTAAYAFFLDKAKARFPEWTTSARACVPWVLGGGIAALLLCLQTEVFYQLQFGAVLIHPASLVAIGVTLGAAVVTCVLFALSPNHDPLSLSERRRARYVYVAEVMLALLFLHIRLTLPWLFTGFIERFWPLVIMVIAYFGVVASEALRRRKVFVLAHPLERTGAFLPLLPVLGFWIVSSEVDFSLLLFIVGGLYGLLSILRRSFGFGVMAAIAGNAGLWYMWNRTGDLQFFQHPQLWLVPVAISGLIAAYLNEDRLSEDQMTGVRYLSLVTIYVSSTADIFINGVVTSPWLPLILGAFSLAGVFAGIVFRIRGLLVLGATFLLLSLVTMIWYASENFGWTWLWYVAGIVTGATIIFMFALFEKKRTEVLRVVEGLKDWEP